MLRETYGNLGERIVGLNGPGLSLSPRLGVARLEILRALDAVLRDQPSANALAAVRRGYTRVGGRVEGLGVRAHVGSLLNALEALLGGEARGAGGGIGGTLEAELLLVPVANKNAVAVLLRVVDKRHFCGRRYRWSKRVEWVVKGESLRFQGEWNECKDCVQQYIDTH